MAARKTKRAPARNRKPAPARKPKLRTLKVALQPTFALEDSDGTLTEVTVGEVVEVAAREWPTFATDAFHELARQVAQQLGAEYEAPPPISDSTA